MVEKKEKKLKKEICIDCDSETGDYYRIQTNRGYVAKCANCYELWILRSSRMTATTTQILKTNQE